MRTPISSVCRAAACALFAAACGGSPPPATSVPALPSAQPSAPAPAVDLSPVTTMPEAMVLTVHASHMSVTADVVGDWAGIPLDVHGPLSEMVGERIAKLVGEDGPADMAILLEDRGEREPSVRFVVSLPVRNADAAQASLKADYGLLPIGNGAYEISRAGGRREGDPDFRVCAFAPAIDGARIVCSRSASVRDAALPYMTRGLPLQKATSDIHVEARSAALHRIIQRNRNRFQTQGVHELRVTRELRPAFENAIGDVLDSLLDADTATLDAMIDKSKGTAELKVKAKSSHGLITRMLTSHPEKAEAVPATFWRLPGDADLAIFGHGLDADQLASPRDQLVRVLDTALAREQALTPGDRKALVDAFAHTLDMLSAPMVYARGVDVAKALQTMAPSTGDAAKVRSAAEQAAGWDVLGVEAPPEKVSASFKEWASAFSRPGMGKWLKDQSSADVAPTWRVVATPAGLPAGSVHLALAVAHDDANYGTSALMGQGQATKARKRPPITTTLHILVVPDQTRAWVVTSLDQATAVARARLVASPSAATGTLASRQGLDALKSARLNAGGFVTLRGLGMGAPLTWVLDSPRQRIANDPLLGTSAQSQGSTPLILGFAETSEGGPGFTMSFDMPRAALADVLQVGPRIFH